MVDIPGYRIVRLLGKGGMASVYLAIQESFGRKVALKVMNPALSADAKFGQRFLSEAKIVSQLIHPNIVTVYDVGISNGQHYLSMEYVPGLDVKTKRLSLTIEESLRIVKDVAKALDYASMKGYVHRDVKPENIMIHAEDGRAVLMDFGIACLADKSSGMTQTGTAIGTPHYMSPEQAKGRAVDSRSDLYSLGVVLFLLVVGRVPYDADSAVAVGIKHISEPIPRLSNNISIIQEIIDKLLAKEPSARYQTGAELVAAIEKLQSNDKAAINLIANQRSSSGVGSHLTEAPTLVSSTIKATTKFNPDNTTMPAVASVSTPTPQKTRVTKPNVSGQSGSVPAVEGRNSSGKNTSSNRVISGKTGSGSLGKNADTARQKQMNKIQSPSSTKINVSQSNQKLGSGEFVAVDKEDVRDYSKKSSSGKWVATFLFLVVIGSAVAGGIYFKHDLPEKLQLIIDNGIEKTDELRVYVYRQLDLSLPSDLNNTQVVDVSEEAAEENTSSVDDMSGADELLVGGSITNATLLSDNVVSTVDEANVESVIVTDTEVGPLAEARILREQLDNDLVVSSRLAELYRNVLAVSPEDKQAAWGLEELKGFHFRKIREFLNARDIAGTNTYLSSLINTFPDIDKDEKYQQTIESIKAIESAQELVEKGNEYFDQKRLISPKGYNALEFYQKALAVDDKNPNALAGVEKILRQYETLINEEIAVEDYKHAISLATKGLEIKPDDEALKRLYTQATAYYQKAEKIDKYFEEAEKQIAIGHLLTPADESAYQQYKNVLKIDSNNSQAGRALKGLEQIVAIEVENKINKSDFFGAKELLASARSYFPGVEKFLALQVSLEKTEEAEYLASQPAISKLVVSSKPIEKINQVMVPTSNLDRTIYIAFSYKNFQSETTVVQAVLYDMARSFQIAQVPVVVSDVDGFKVFSIDRPVEGFAEGGYNIDLIVDGKQVGTLAFRVENRASSEVPVE